MYPLVHLPDGGAAAGNPAGGPGRFPSESKKSKAPKSGESGQSAQQHTELDKRPEATIKVRAAKSTQEQEGARGEERRGQREERRQE